MTFEGAKIRKVERITKNNNSFLLFFTQNLLHTL